MIFLMYHELETPGRSLCQDPEGYRRYVVNASDFRAQMHALKDMGWRGVSVTDALEFSLQTVAITFDDGSETDLLTAAPLLSEIGFGATFYITAGFFGTRGHLSPGQLSGLSSLGFEIGCHSMTHPYLPDLDENGLHREIIDAKVRLEQITGKPVQHFSCPGGRYNQKSIEVAKAAGYRTVATSDIKQNFKDTDRFSLGRIAVMRGTALDDFKKHCRGNGLLQLKIRDSIGRNAKRVMGNGFYDYLRTKWLDG